MILPFFLGFLRKPPPPPPFFFFEKLPRFCFSNPSLVQAMNGTRQVPSSKGFSVQLKHRSVKRWITTLCWVCQSKFMTWKHFGKLIKLQKTWHRKTGCRDGRIFQMWDFLSFGFCGLCGMERGLEWLDEVWNYWEFRWFWLC